MRVADTIKELVMVRDLKRGDRLPAESEMIQSFGMAKSTIREAMRILEAQGLVETRTGPGGGSFVGEPSAERARALLGNYFYFKDVKFAEVYQLRRLLEPELVASLAGVLTEDQLEELELLAEQFPTPPQTVEEARAYHIGSLEFHVRLASFAQNDLLGFVIGFLATTLSELTVSQGGAEHAAAALWRKGRLCRRHLLMALREGAPGEARKVMLEFMLAEEAMMLSQNAALRRRFVPG
ncbi:FadR/GntR family transcriptional regulator [Roseobacter sp.]|uniref:FadR/GntR family transcriptional regulator n=1 Tax=Roseobacter sp. TaxID=1907202 RepID=UPI00296770EE|nr:GntR family transcriptional regulator [Roseobacter sp.]MDW3183216.1 GntR family transcriptional regulator [Roseobacter sp.]